MQVWYGFLGGLLATVGLEIVRHVGFLLGGMPGEMPKLLGVLLLDRFALGPNWLSNIAGWGYHFWNGAAFGIVYTLLFGKPRLWGGIGFGVLIGIGFMISPATTALGIGIFGIQFNPGGLTNRTPDLKFSLRIRPTTSWGRTCWDRTPRKSSISLLWRSKKIFRPPHSKT